MLPVLALVALALAIAAHTQIMALAVRTATSFDDVKVELEEVKANISHVKVRRITIFGLPPREIVTGCRESSRERSAGGTACGPDRQLPGRLVAGAGQIR